MARRNILSVGQLKSGISEPGSLGPRPARGYGSRAGTALDDGLCGREIGRMTGLGGRGPAGKLADLPFWKGACATATPSVPR